MSALASVWNVSVERAPGTNGAVGSAQRMAPSVSTKSSRMRVAAPLAAGR